MREWISAILQAIGVGLIVFGIIYLIDRTTGGDDTDGMA